VRAALLAGESSRAAEPAVLRLDGPRLTPQRNDAGAASKVPHIEERAFLAKGVGSATGLVSVLRSFGWRRSMRRRLACCNGVRTARRGRSPDAFRAIPVNGGLGQRLGRAGGLRSNSGDEEAETQCMRCGKVVAWAAWQAAGRSYSRRRCGA